MVLCGMVSEGNINILQLNLMKREGGNVRYQGKGEE
jgi:hypothetical protein